MKLFKIPVFWQMYGYMDIEAETLEEATEEAYSSERPLPDGDYVDGTFDVDEDIVEDMNPDLIQEEEYENEIKEEAKANEN